MAYKDLYMLVLDVSSGGKHFMGTMPLSSRSPQGGHAIACQNGAAAVADLKRRIRNQNQMKKRRARMLLSRYMH
jgi:hypothetical protein